MPIWLRRLGLVAGGFVLGVCVAANKIGIESKTVSYNTTVNKTTASSSSSANGPNAATGLHLTFALFNSGDSKEDKRGSSFATTAFADAKPKNGIAAVEEARNANGMTAEEQRNYDRLHS